MTNEQYRDQYDKAFSPFLVNDVETVEEFVKTYYKLKLVNDENFLKYAIEAHLEEFEDVGITAILSADSKTGNIVSFKNRSN